MCVVCLSACLFSKVCLFVRWCAFHLPFRFAFNCLVGVLVGWLVGWLFLWLIVCCFRDGLVVCLVVFGLCVV